MRLKRTVGDEDVFTASASAVPHLHYCLHRRDAVSGKFIPTNAVADSGQALQRNAMS